MYCTRSRVNLPLLRTGFPSWSIPASSRSLPCIVTALRNPHVLISGPQPSSWWKFTACQGHYHPRRCSMEEKGGKTPFSVDAITFLTLSSYSFDWNRAIKPAALGPWFWEILLLLLQQHFREPVVISGCNSHPWGLPPAQDATCPLRTRLTSKDSNKQRHTAVLHLINSNVKSLIVIWTLIKEDSYWL